MARAGDGKPRSARRRCTAQIAVRMTPAEKEGLRQRAQAEGCPSLSAWVAMRLTLPAVAIPATSALRVGLIGHIGGRLQALAEQCGTLPRAEIGRQLLELNVSLAELQMELLGQGEVAP